MTTRRCTRPFRVISQVSGVLSLLNCSPGRAVYFIHLALRYAPGTRRQPDHCYSSLPCLCPAGQGQGGREPGGSLGRFPSESPGADRILTVDIRSERDEQLFQVPLISLSPASQFAKEIHSRGLTDTTIVAPDHGAVRRCQAVRAAAGLQLARHAIFREETYGSRRRA